MFTKAEYKKNLLGCFEVMLFMRQGPARFSNTKRDAIRSFFWPAVLMPVVLFIFSFHSVGFSLPLLLTLHFGRIVVGLILFLAFIYMFSKYFNREEHFYQFVNATNWLNVPVFLLMVPVVFSLGMSAAGAGAPYDAIAGNYQSYSVFITMLAYVYTAFVMTHVLRMPWELAGAFTIVGVAIDQTLMDVTIALRDYLSVI